MRILHISDLHFCLDHYAWLEKQASSYDLVVIAGDLLELYESGTLIPNQQVQVLASLKRIAQATKWLVVGTGNHDVDGGRSEWLSPLKAQSNIILDGQNKLIEGDPSLLITCCPWTEPYDERGEGKLKRLLQDGAVLRLKHKAQWLIVHHSPPGFGPECQVLDDIIHAEHPDLILSGHDHATPFQSGPCRTLNSTLCLNPGVPPRDRFQDHPAAISIDLVSRMVNWKWNRQQKHTTW